LPAAAKVCHARRWLGVGTGGQPCAWGCDLLVGYRGLAAGRVGLRRSLINGSLRAGGYL
jgi:hypothetical protein